MAYLGFFCCIFRKCLKIDRLFSDLMRSHSTLRRFEGTFISFLPLRGASSPKRQTRCEPGTQSHGTRWGFAGLLKLREKIS